MIFTGLAYMPLLQTMKVMFYYLNKLMEIKDGDFNKIGSELQDYSLSLIHDHQSHLQCDDE